LEDISGPLWITLSQWERGKGVVRKGKGQQQKRKGRKKEVVKRKKYKKVLKNIL
jgi:hypothetical protein